MSDGRDLDLGAALRALPTPEHGPGFWEELEEQLASGGPPRRSSRRLRSSERHRRRLPGTGVVAVAAAVSLVAAAAVVLRPSDERGNTRVATDPPTTQVTSPAPTYRAGPERSLGEGIVAAVSADGSAVLVLADDPDTDARGCEGTAAKTLFASPLDGGDRRRAVAGAEPVAGTVVRSPADPSRVAIFSVCEEFLTDLVVAREGPGGTLSDLVAVDLDDLAGLVGRFEWTRDGSALLGIVAGTGEVVRVDPATGRREVLAGGGEAFQVGELADGTLAVLTGAQRLRLGDVTHTVPAVGMAVSPDGRQVAAFGDGVWLFAPGQAPRQLTAERAIAATWSPDGRALVVTGQGPYPEGGALSIVTLDGDLSVLATAGVVQSAHFTADGRVVAFTRTEPGAGGDTGEVPVERAVVVRFD